MINPGTLYIIKEKQTDLILFQSVDIEYLLKIGLTPNEVSVDSVLELNQKIYRILNIEFSPYSEERIYLNSKYNYTTIVWVVEYLAVS